MALRVGPSAALVSFAELGGAEEEEEEEEEVAALFARHGRLCWKVPDVHPLVFQ